MEAASGGYHEVGKVLIMKGADVNAAPVPSSRDTALTIAADKGHYRYSTVVLYVHVWYASKRMQQFVKFVCRFTFLIRKVSHFYVLPLDLWGKHEVRYCVTFCQTHHNFCLTHRNSVKRDAFSREKRRNPRICVALQDGALSGIASKCGAHGGISTAHDTRYATLISAAAARLLHSFWRVLYVCTCTLYMCLHAHGRYINNHVHRALLCDRKEKETQREKNSNK